MKIVTYTMPRSKLNKVYIGYTETLARFLRGEYRGVSVDLIGDFYGFIDEAIELALHYDALLIPLNLEGYWRSYYIVKQIQDSGVRWRSSQNKFLSNMTFKVYQEYMALEAWDKRDTVPDYVNYINGCKVVNQRDARSVAVKVINEITEHTPEATHNYIAHCLNEMKIPRIRGKGKWCQQSVRRLRYKMEGISPS